MKQIFFPCGKIDDEYSNFLQDDCLYTTGRACKHGACLGSQCYCNDGYGGKGCDMPDANECKYRPCDVFGYCTNTLGGYFCACHEGYEGDGATCRDVDECKIPEKAARCVENAECCNLPAHYTCKCKAGFVGDGFVECRGETIFYICVLKTFAKSTQFLSDVDECLGNTACGSNALCVNTVGNHTCECQQGFQGNPYNGVSQ